MNIYPCCLTWRVGRVGTLLRELQHSGAQGGYKETNRTSAELTTVVVSSALLLVICVVLVFCCAAVLVILVALLSNISASCKGSNEAESVIAVKQRAATFL